MAAWLRITVFQLLRGKEDSQGAGWGGKRGHLGQPCCDIFIHMNAAQAFAVVRTDYDSRHVGKGGWGDVARPLLQNVSRVKRVIS